MSIDWASYLVVLGAAALAAVGGTALFSLGIRLLATPGRGAPGGTARDDELDEAPPRRPASTAGAVAFFVLFGALALFAIWLIVPALHR